MLLRDHCSPETDMPFSVVSCCKCLVVGMIILFLITKNALFLLIKLDFRVQSLEKKLEGIMVIWFRV